MVCDPGASTSFSTTSSRMLRTRTLCCCVAVVPSPATAYNPLVQISANKIRFICLHPFHSQHSNFGAGLQSGNQCSLLKDYPPFKKCLLYQKIKSKMCQSTPAQLSIGILSSSIFNQNPCTPSRGQISRAARKGSPYQTFQSPKDKIFT